MTLGITDVITVRNSTKLQQLPQSAVEGTFLFWLVEPFTIVKPLFFILLGKPLSFIPEEGGAEGIPGV